MSDQHVLRLPAIEISQGSRRIYTFAVDGKVIHDFAAVSRVHRDESGLDGYQRPEVLTHVRAIRRYLESDGAMLPNAIVFAFDDRVSFRATGPSNGHAVVGELNIPVDRSLSEGQRPALIVDGQQRSAAIRDSELDVFPVAAVGFIASGLEDQRAQFILVNNTKPLPKGLIHELLPDTTGELPVAYARRKLPAQLMMRLNTDGDSPFQGRISMPTAPDGYIKDNSVLRMIENSLYEGALYQYRDPVTGGGDIETMVTHLKIFWQQVVLLWEDDWCLPPRRSRLTHGVGIRSMGYVMDELTEGKAVDELKNDFAFRSALQRLTHVVAWSEGNWGFADDDTPRWNSLQNSPNDVRRLTTFLLGVCRQRVAELALQFPGESNANS
ncbi:DGQHR domain-containing protein DpdB [Oerskovia sp. NPDC060338]|uniref:DGQHR domain-containing protein DpdB n=1 Tax=Oerskovia sp. NPDC060338 TaxID=3347100 RepID=UPI0036502398